MKSASKSNWLSIAGLLLALPTAYFICISVLKYAFHINGPFDTSTPLLERWGINESLGWNINLLLLFGPVAGFLFSIIQVLVIKSEFTKDDFEFRFIIRKRWLPILVAVFSACLIATLFLYFLGENCNC
jgi:hypothetical protein